jgi:ferredoxin/flavodoxin
VKTTLFYFSGTGNSLAVARNIAKKLNDCSLKPVAKAMQENDFAIDSPKVGFVFPLYYLGIPKIVQDFLQQVELGGVQYIFIVVTKGWPVVGGAISQMKQLLKKKGVALDAGMYIRLPMNDITMVTVASPKTQERLYLKSPHRIAKIVAIIRANKKHYDREILGFEWPFRNLPFIERVNREDKNFAVNSNCNGCGICGKVCPVGNIKLERTPQWLGRCELCLACYHFCPQKAITFNQRSKGVQYHHPEVNMADIWSQK